MATIAAQVKAGRKNAEKIFADMTGANSPATKAASRALQRAIRKVLSVKANVTRRSFTGETERYEPSAPGEAPRLNRGNLRKSIGDEVVGGVRRVGSASFIGRLLNEGVDTSSTQTPSGRVFGTRRRKAGKARRGLHIAARPFMEQALELALPNMEGEAVGDLQKRERSIPLGPFA